MNLFITKLLPHCILTTNSWGGYDKFSIIYERLDDSVFFLLNFQRLAYTCPWINVCQEMRRVGARTGRGGYNVRLHSYQLAEPRLDPVLFASRVLQFPPNQTGSDRLELCEWSWIWLTQDKTWDMRPGTWGRPISKVFGSQQHLNCLLSLGHPHSSRKKLVKWSICFWLYLRSRVRDQRPRAPDPGLCTLLIFKCLTLYLSLWRRAGILRPDFTSLWFAETRVNSFPRPLAHRTQLFHLLSYMSKLASTGNIFLNHLDSWILPPCPSNTPYICWHVGVVNSRQSTGPGVPKPCIYSNSVSKELWSWANHFIELPQFTHFLGLTDCSVMSLLGLLFHELNAGSYVCTFKLNLLPGVSCCLWDMLCLWR